MKNLIIIFLLFVLRSTYAQTDTVEFYNQTLSKNNFSIELGGKAYLYSIGYERNIFNSKKVLLTGSVNISYQEFAGFPGILMPVGINVCLGEKKNKFLFSLFTTNGIDFNPYPKTKKEREEFRATENYQNEKYYRQPYRLYFIVPCIGYRRYFKNGNSLTIDYNHISYNNYGKVSFDSPGFLPWLGVKYNVALNG